MERVSLIKLVILYLFQISVWRWFNEEVLQCTTKELLEKGLNLDEMTILARCNGLHTQTFRATSDDHPSEKLL